MGKRSSFARIDRDLYPTPAGGRGWRRGTIVAALVVLAALLAALAAAGFVLAARAAGDRGGPATLKDPQGPPVVRMQCGERAAVIAALRRKFGESRRMTGTVGSPETPRVVEVWAAASSWTITETFAAGGRLVTCLRWAGHDVRFEPPGVPL